MHFSGTLLSALQWYSPKTIELLKVGIDRGQFEILGSSFSQNILLATDEWDNIQQLRQHRQQLKDMGYADWFDYASHAAKNIETREVYYQVSRRLQDQERRLTERSQETPGYAAGRRLYDLAVRTLVAHQYEFGCTGLEFDKEAAWQLARSALAVLWASQAALGEHQDPLVKKEDVNGDGVDEIAVICDTSAYLFSPKGGRLLYWFDLRDGLQLVGNQNALCYFELYRDDHSYVPDFYGEKDVFSELKGRPEIADLAEQRYVMRRRCLNDAISFDDMRMAGLHDLVFDVDVVAGQQRPILQFRHNGRLFSLQKTVTCLPDGIEVEYTIDWHLDARKLRLLVENEITPDYLSVLDTGKQWVEVQTDGCNATVVNKARACAVTVTPLGPPGSSVVSHVEPGFLAWLCSTEVTVDLAARAQQSARVGLSLRLS
ncbi:MAG TPA: hypothetical protein PLY10_10635 [Bacillota bacterium]|nr:hypothetical protein [Bacillota bacterium]HPZ55501.1 hypothetical protein [Bacillota bacterium]HQD18188.1 hypothetical protein [Bacillota bacterium]